MTAPYVERGLLLFHIIIHATLQVAHAGAGAVGPVLAGIAGPV